MRQDIAMKYNRRIFPVYKGIGWDPLFYSAIIFLFLTQVKGIEASKVLYAESAYGLFALLFQIPVTIMIERLGNRKSLIVGNLLVAIHVAMILIVNHFGILLVAYMIFAFGTCMKDVSECTVLYDATKVCKGKNCMENIDSKGSTASYVLQAITSVMAGYLFVINPYIPIILSSMLCMLAVLIAYRFEEIESEETKSTTVKETIKDMKEGFQFIIHSHRLKALLLFTSLFVGVLMMISTYEKSLLQDLKVKPQYFGIIFALLTLEQGVAVQFQNKIHNKFRNKTLAFLSIPVFVSFILIGIIVALNLNHTFTIMTVILMFAVQHFLRAPYWTLENKYITNFTDDYIRVKILSANKTLKAIFKIVITFLAGLLLEYYTTSKAYFIVGVIGLVMITLVLRYMQRRVGLDPDEYQESDIKYKKQS